MKTVACFLGDRQHARMSRHVSLSAPRGSESSLRAGPALPELGSIDTRVHRCSVNLGEGITEGQNKQTVPEVLIDVDPIITVGITVRQFNSTFNKYLLTKRRARFLGSEGSSWAGPRTGPPGGLLGRGSETTVCQLGAPQFQAPSPQSGPRPLRASPDGSQNRGTFSPPWRPPWLHGF